MKDITEPQIQETIQTEAIEVQKKSLPRNIMQYCKKSRAMNFKAARKQR